MFCSQSFCLQGPQKLSQKCLKNGQNCSDHLEGPNFVFKDETSLLRILLSRRLERCGYRFIFLLKRRNTQQHFQVAVQSTAKRENNLFKFRAENYSLCNSHHVTPEGLDDNFEKCIAARADVDDETNEGC